MVTESDDARLGEQLGRVPDARRDAGRETASRPSPTSRHRVLVVDDDAQQLRALSKLLAQEGYVVDVATTGRAALAVARREPPDVALVDVSLANENGFELCVVLRKQVRPRPQVIFVTALESSDALAQGFEVGGADYVTKPFDAVELIARIRSAIAVKRRLERLEAQACTDALTGLWNRRQLPNRIAELAATADRTGISLACLMLDIDHFKSINDTFGHLAGDGVLQETARRLQQATRRSDVLFRFGGEEFVVLAPNASEDKAVLAADGLRKRLGSRPFEMEESSGAHQRVTASIGVALWTPGLESEELVRRADAALYSAKRRGRDQVAVYGAPSQNGEAG